MAKPSTTKVLTVMILPGIPAALVGGVAHFAVASLTGSTTAALVAGLGAGLTTNFFVTRSLMS